MCVYGSDKNVSVTFAYSFYSTTQRARQEKKKRHDEGMYEKKGGKRNEKSDEGRGKEGGEGGREGSEALLI